MRKSAHAGQALLIILLVMAVVLTIGLSVVSRSITDIAVSQKEEEAARAFSAAEAGIERALIGETTGTLDIGKFRATINDLVETGGTEFVLPPLLSSGDTAAVWLVGRDGDGNLGCDNSDCYTGEDIRVCWGEEGATITPTPAVEISIIYTDDSDGEDVRIARATYDPAGRSNAFSGPDTGGSACTVQSQTFAFKTPEIELKDYLGVTKRDNSNDQHPGPQVVRIRMLYNTDQVHQAGLLSDDPLPPQGDFIESVGTAEGSDVTRKIEVYKPFRDLPPIFDFGVFSGSGGISK